MHMTREQMLTLMRHPAIGLDQGGLAILTGLDARKIRRLGSQDSHHIPQVLSQWMVRRIREDPDGSRRPAFGAWEARKEGSDPPPNLRGYRWPDPPPRETSSEAVVVEDRRRGRFT